MEPEVRVVLLREVVSASNDGSAVSIVAIICLFVLMSIVVWRVFSLLEVGRRSHRTVSYILPGDPAFERELLHWAAANGGMAGRDYEGYYIVANGRRQRVRALLPGQGG